MRKIFLILIAVFTMALFTACGSGDKEPLDEADSIQIVTTIFPEYDWVMNILGENPAGAEVTMLLDSGVDLHSYQPTSEDMLKISDCDLFIYVGGESDEWVEDTLESAANEDRVVISLMDVLGDKVKEEEVVEGMEAEEEEEGEAEGEEEAEEEGPEMDEHVWLSLKNASVICDSLAEAIASIDEENAGEYEANLAAYKEQLTALDEEYREAVSGAAVKTLLFGDRFPFRYMTDEYGLDYYAAFVGCSAETEASFETIKFLADKVNELGLSHIMTIEGSDKRIAETIIQNADTKDQTILTLDSMQSTTSQDAEGGADYISIMQSNLKVLKEALQ